MTKLVPPEEIEALVGAPRHTVLHLGRVTGDQVYIMHSQRCLDSGIDLRECRFSEALDQGLDELDWWGREDRTVVLAQSWSGELVPVAPLEGPPEFCTMCGCFDLDATDCISRTGAPCSWVTEGRCSACASEAA